METVKALRIGGDGKATEVEVPVEEVRETVARAELDTVGGSSLSDADAAAMAWLEAQEQEAGPSIVTREIEGRAWHLKRLSDEEFTLALLLTPRTDNGNIDLRNQATWSALHAAFLHVGLARGADDTRPLFGLNVARRYAASRALTGLVLELYSELSNFNADLLPKVPGPGAPNPEEEITPQISSSDSPGNVTPALSPTGSAFSESTGAETAVPSEKSPADGDSTSNS